MNHMRTDQEETGEGTADKTGQCCSASEPHKQKKTFCTIGCLASDTWWAKCVMNVTLFTVTALPPWKIQQCSVSPGRTKKNPPFILLQSRHHRLLQLGLSTGLESLPNPKYLHRDPILIIQGRILGWVFSSIPNDSPNAFDVLVWERL